MNWIDTNTLIAICTCAIGLTQFLFWRYIAKQKSYEAEKGKNLATKEDIKEITDKVESVKANYNEALERHKFELQQKLENTKYIINLCNSLDNKLISLLVDCRNTILKERKEHTFEDEGSSISSCLSLCDFLSSYQTRYGNNENVQLIIKEYDEIEGERMRGQMGEKINPKKYWESIKAIYDNTDTLLKQFLPELSSK